MKDSLRSITLGPWNPKDPAIAKYFGGGSTLSGISVNEESALAISAVWSAVTMISDDIASLPLMLYKRDTKTGGKDRFEDHPLYRLLHDAPNPEMDSMVLRRTMQAHVLLWQNAYAEIERNNAGQPIALWPLVPESVSLVRDSARQLSYRVKLDDGRDVYIPPADMLHLVGYSHDGSVGCSMAKMARESFGLTLASEKYGAAFYGNGASMGGVISVPGPRPAPQTEEGHRNQIEARHQGVDRAHKLLVLYNDAKFTANVIPPNAGQFNETRIHQIREVARWFKIPPHKLGDLADATYSNVEQMDAVYLSSCIRPWLTLWEQQLTRKLVRPLEQRIQFIQHETHGFLSVDAASRAQLYQAESHVGSLKINEIRGYENRDPIAGGDQVFIDLNRIPLPLVTEYWQAQIDAQKAKAEADRRPPPTPVVSKPETNSAEVDTLRRELDLARRKAQETEDSLDREKLATVEARAEALKYYAESVALQSDLDATIKQRDIFNAKYLVTQDHGNLLLAERDAARAEIAQKDSEYATALGVIEVGNRNTEKLVAERDAEKAARLAVEAERQEARDAAEQWRQKADESAGEVKRWAADWEVLKAELDAEKSARAADAETLRNACDAARDERDRAQAALDDERLVVESFKPVVKELRADLETAQAALLEARNDLVKLTADEESARIERDMLSADIDTLQAQLAERDAALEDAKAARRVAMTAMRPLMVDTIERLLQREIDRARKNQATPEKLRAWMGNFYPNHAESVRTHLKPVVEAWVALAGGDAEATLDRLVARHLDASQSALRSIAETDDPEQMGADLARLLLRWETERADAVADGWLKEGMGR